MERISAEYQKQLLAETDLVQLAGEFTQLRPVGKNWKGLCPFHKEETPSFTVSPEKQIFKCFGCGQGGNAIGLIMKMERKTFPEAIRSLALRSENVAQPGTVYVLELEAGHYYIGYTQHLDHRIKQHFAGEGAEWTKLHQPVRIVEKFEKVSAAMENEITQRYMLRFGWRKVRGGDACFRKMAYNEMPDHICRRKKDGAYLLELKHGKYYIGFAQDMQADIQKQFDGIGAAWTQLHPPVKALRMVKSLHIETQKRLTLEAIGQYGRENVRGYLGAAIQ